MSAAAGFPVRRYVVLLIVLVFVATLPLLSVLGAGLVADIGGCRLDEGSVHPCMIAGMDLGEPLYTAEVLGWLMLVTIPLGFLACAALGIVWVIHYLAWRRRGRLG